MVGFGLTNTPERGVLGTQLNAIELAQILRQRTLQLQAISAQQQAWHRPTSLVVPENVPMPCQSPLFRQLFPESPIYSHSLEPLDCVLQPIVLGTHFSLRFRVSSEDGSALKAAVRFVIVLVAFEDHPHLIDSQLSKTVLVGKSTAWGKHELSFPSLLFTGVARQFRERNLALCVVAPGREHIQPFFIYQCIAG